MQMTSWIERQIFGDPGRVHFEGRVVREAIERARDAVASLCGTTSNRVVFTSGATEAFWRTFKMAASSNGARA